MKENDIAKLGFKGYEVIKVQIEKAAEEKKESNVGFLFKVAKEKAENASKANLFIGVQIETAGEKGYIVEVVIKGNFIMEDMENENCDEAIVRNASAILFPYLRSIVSVMTSQLECETIILPTMNFYKFFEETEKEELFLPIERFEDFK